MEYKLWYAWIWFAVSSCVAIIMLSLDVSIPVILAVVVSMILLIPIVWLLSSFLEGSEERRKLYDTVIKYEKKGGYHFPLSDLKSNFTIYDWLKGTNNEVKNELEGIKKKLYLRARAGGLNDMVLNEIQRADIYNIPSLHVIVHGNQEH